MDGGEDARFAYVIVSEDVEPDGQDENLEADQFQGFRQVLYAGISKVSTSCQSFRPWQHIAGTQDSLVRRQVAQLTARKRRRGRGDEALKVYCRVLYVGNDAGRLETIVVSALRANFLYGGSNVRFGEAWMTIPLLDKITRYAESLSEAELADFESQRVRDIVDDVVSKTETTQYHALMRNSLAFLEARAGVESNDDVVTCGDLLDEDFRQSCPPNTLSR